MNIKKFKKLIATSLTSLALTTGLASSAMAEWSSSVEWGSQTASYAPDYGNTSFYKQWISSTSSYSISPKARFNFNSSAITAIHNYYNNNSYYYGFDIAVGDYETTLDAYDTFYINSH